MMQDFAKLFWVAGIGQILVTLAESEDGHPAVILRIPDVDNVTLAMTIATPSNDDNYAAEEKFARAVFDSVTQDSAGKAVKPLLEFRDRFLAQAAAK